MRYGRCCNMRIKLYNSRITEKKNVTQQSSVFRLAINKLFMIKYLPCFNLADGFFFFSLLSRLSED